jgi:hypothetical protein
MAKHFRLQRKTASCETVLRRSQYADYSVGTVCKTASGWTYRSIDGPAMPTTTKRAAIKGLLMARKRWIGNRSALEGARRRRRKRSR